MLEDKKEHWALIKKIQRKCFAKNKASNLVIS
jgi:hypothetical protein